MTVQRLDGRTVVPLGIIIYNITNISNIINGSSSSSSCCCCCVQTNCCKRINPNANVSLHIQLNSIFKLYFYKPNAITVHTVSNIFQMQSELQEAKQRYRTQKTVSSRGQFINKSDDNISLPTKNALLQDDDDDDDDIKDINQSINQFLGWPM